MRPVAKLAAFAVLLVGLLGAGYGVGIAVSPAGSADRQTTGHEDDMQQEVDR